MRGVFQGPFAPGKKMDGTGVTVLAIDLGVPAAQTLFAHCDVVLQTIFEVSSLVVWYLKFQSSSGLVKSNPVRLSKEFESFSCVSGILPLLSWLEAAPTEN